MLAAGGGSRFVAPAHKLLAELNGRPLVRFALDAAIGAGLDETAVVTGAVDLGPIVPAGVTVLDNPEWREGLASSIGVGLAWAAERGHEAVVVGLGDQPFVPSRAWSAVARSQSPIAVATFGGDRRPPVRLAADTWSLVPRSGDIGARVLFSSRPDLVVEVPCDGDPADIDTLEDLHRWS